MRVTFFAFNVRLVRQCTFGAILARFGAFVLRQIELEHRFLCFLPLLPLILRFATLLPYVRILFCV